VTSTPSASGSTAAADSLNAPGEYDLAVGALDLGPLAVEEPTQEQPEGTDSSLPWGIIAIAVVLVLVSGIVALRQRNIDASHDRE